ncbi:MAG: glucose-6-phosphate dehydrogenase [Porphyromonadaceae bacterium]|nr:glucose-6-phosphate dehydrogenase [Porphyromonadaceae bacterium]
MEELRKKLVKGQVDGQVLMIFGVNGDLSKRKLLPSIFQLYIDDLLPKKFIVIGCGSDKKDENAFREDVEENMKLFADDLMEKHPEKFDTFKKIIYYKSVRNREKEDFDQLKNYTYSLTQKLNIPHNFIYYFSIPPFMYEIVANHLVVVGLNTEDDGWKRVIVEKPFGYSLDSAIELDEKLHKGFREHQIYRIDHYLGKETVQNIMVTRFANGFFEPLWNRRYIDRVEITAAEKIGVEDRGGYFESSGTMRDMIQNHLLQVLAVIAMDPPAVFDSDSIRNETVKVLQALRPIQPNEVSKYVVRGQYTEGKRRGEVLRGYREEKDVDPNSMTETFVALKLFVDNWRWSDVPFYIRSGKNLPVRVTEIVIHLKPAPLQLFKEKLSNQITNMIILRIHPDAGIAIDFEMKIPGAGYNVQSVNMDFHYSDLEQSKIPDAYERLLLDCMVGDSTLYARADAVRASWKFVDPILNAWRENPKIPLYMYPSNTWGPAEADGLFENKDLQWKDQCDKFFCEI